MEKSRYVKEKSKIPIGVSWEGGVQRYSGLLDVALAGGYVVKPSNGWYQRVDTDTGEVVGNKVRTKDTLSAEFWEPVFESTNFAEFLEKTYKIGYNSNINAETIVEEAV